MNPRVIGFDLDMTLIDSRPGIKAVYDALAAETGTSIDSDLVVSRLGPPVELELAHWFPTEQVPALADRYRELYPSVAIERIVALPGAHEALAAAQEYGRVVLVTAKATPSARAHVEHLGLAIDDVYGRAWREGKADMLREQGASVFVGDHEHDMEAARLAGIVGVGVTTGPCSPDELRAAGADVVLDTLRDLPAWLAER